MVVHPLQQVKDTIKAGQYRKARKTLQHYLKKHPKSADGWALYSATTKQPSEKAKYLKRALYLNPEHSYAQRKYKQLKAKYQKKQSSKQPQKAQKKTASELSRIPSTANTVLSGENALSEPESQSQKLLDDQSTSKFANHTQDTTSPNYLWKWTKKLGGWMWRHPRLTGTVIVIIGLTIFARVDPQGFQELINVLIGLCIGLVVLFALIGSLLPDSKGNGPEPKPHDFLVGCRIWKGNRQRGGPALTLNEGRIWKGDNTSGRVVARYEGGKVWFKDNTYGRPDAYYDIESVFHHNNDNPHVVFSNGEAWKGDEQRGRPDAVYDASINLFDVGAGLAYLFRH